MSEPIFFNEQERKVLIKALERLKEEYVLEDVAELGFTPVLGVDAHSTGPFQPELETAIDDALLAFTKITRT